MCLCISKAGSSQPMTDVQPHTRSAPSSTSSCPPMSRPVAMPTPALRSLSFFPFVNHSILQGCSHTRPPCSPDISLLCGPSGHLLCMSISFPVAPLCLLFTLGKYFSSWVLTSDSLSLFLDSRGECEQTVCKHRLVDFAESLPPSIC